MSDAEPWDGAERRSAPLHLIKYVDGRMLEHTQHIEQILRDHVTDEMHRFGSIQHAIDELARVSRERHEQTLSQWETHLSRTEAMEQAFLEDHHGKPDFNGHHADHSVRAKAGAWWADVKNKTTTKLIEWASVALAAWLILNFWQAFLKGPTP